MVKNQRRLPEPCLQFSFVGHARTLSLSVSGCVSPVFGLFCVKVDEGMQHVICMRQRHGGRFTADAQSALLDSAMMPMSSLHMRQAQISQPQSVLCMLRNTVYFLGNIYMPDRLA